MTTQYSICVFSWDTNGLPLSETLNPTDAEYHRSGYAIPFTNRRLTTWQCSTYDIPDFYYELEDYILKGKFDIVIIGFQEDRYPGSYFHSHLLPELLPKVGYGLVKRNKLMDNSFIPCVGLMDGNMYEKGLRVSIYARNRLIPSVLWEEEDVKKGMATDLPHEYMCNSHGQGATLSYLRLPGISPISIICCHLPFDSNSLITTKMHQNYMLRQNDLNNNNVCFNNIYEELVLYHNNKNNNVIYFGNFNYRLNDSRPASDVALEFEEHNNDREYYSQMYKLYDELYDQMNRGNVYTFCEGVDNNGPLFPPTAKMTKNRNNAIQWNCGKYDQRNPSWCDRILYKAGLNNIIQCLYYDRFDSGETMKKSSHAGIISILKISSQ